MLMCSHEMQVYILIFQSAYFEFRCLKNKYDSPHISQKILLTFNQRFVMLDSFVDNKVAIQFNPIFDLLGS